MPRFEIRVYQSTRSNRASRRRQVCRPRLSQLLMFVTLSYGPQFETHDRYNIYVQQELRMQTTLWTVTGKTPAKMAGETRSFWGG